MLSQVKAVEQKLQIESSEQPDESLTIEELKTAAEMFLYLNTCPDSWFKSWYSFYKDLFLTQSADQIILTLNRILKTETLQDWDGKRIAIKLFQRAASLLSLQFEEFGSLLRGKYFEDISSTDFKIPKGAIFHHNLSFVYFLIKDLDSTAINHPVHIITKDKQLSPSALIPFCDFGGNMSAMGVKIDLFDVPICSSFQAKIMNDQLCYAVDLNKYSQKSNTKNELKLGFSFLMDYNEDRQVTFDHNISKKELGLVNVASSDDDQHAFVYLDTIGKNNDFIYIH